jgi:ATP:ADP antiporter, AAA family
LNHIFRLEPGEWPKLLQFGLFGFLLQMGMGIGFSAGDAAFLSNVGADSLPIIFLLIPLVMLLYTVIFSYFLVRTSIGHTVDFTLGALIVGGVTLWALLDAGLDPEWQTILYYIFKLYLAVWYIALYTLFWNFTDTYFDIQDAKRLFPLFAAFCGLGTATGALFVSLFAASIPMHSFLLV